MHTRWSGALQYGKRKGSKIGWARELRLQQHACQREPRVLLLQVDAYDFEGVGELAVEERILVSGEHVDLPCAHDS